ncbi:hypothetical protein IFM89_027061 [Coptis chinensis]|uniref:PPM-type phosphatase domain-containing protein n=1 Tax=Coptis chinensis TaxID=261450 RepID=A0A835HXP6_9MAGN|nr:hypothetical protein IFM89_027061 [Coptis chinensis]
MANENDPERILVRFEVANIPIPVILQVNHLESLHDDKNDDKKVVIIEPYSSVEYGERRVYRKNDIGFFPGFAKESGSITEGVLRNAFRATENGFMSVVSERFINHPLIRLLEPALVGILWKKTLFVANLGDSRAVLGSVNRSGDHLAKQLTVEHNANKEEVRQRPVITS